MTLARGGRGLSGDIELTSDRTIDDCRNRETVQIGELRAVACVDLVVAHLSISYRCDGRSGRELESFAT